MTTVDLSEFDVPGRGRGLLDVVRWRYLLRLLVRKGTATRYRNSTLGWAWSYVKPAILFLVYYFVMGIIFDTASRPALYPIYLFSGIVAVNLFTEAFGNATNSIVDNKALVRKIYLPRELFPIAAIIGAFVHFLPQLAILLVVCIAVGWVPTLLGVVAILVGVLLVIAFSLGIGLFFSGINVRYRDAQNFVDVIKMVSLWASPVLYTWNLVQDRAPQWLLPIYMSNPVTVAVELFHYGFWQPAARLQPGSAELSSLPPNFLLYAGVAGTITIVLLIVGQLVFRRFERSFAQDL